jgi:hypothetical protein
LLPNTSTHQIPRIPQFISDYASLSILAFPDDYLTSIVFQLSLKTC